MKKKNILTENLRRMTESFNSRNGITTGTGFNEKRMSAKPISEDSEEYGDGWNQEVLEDSGFFHFAEMVEELLYEAKNGSRGSYAVPSNGEDAGPQDFLEYLYSISVALEDVTSNLEGFIDQGVWTEGE